MKAKAFLVILILTVLVAFLPSQTPVKAQQSTISLFGSSVPLHNNLWGGWGYTIDSISQPGPTLTVAQGQVVSINLTSADNATHRFFVDYNENKMIDPGEPDSGNFGPMNVSVIFQFTVNQTGNFNYYCAHHPNIMFGQLIATASIPEFPITIILATGLIVISLISLAYRRKFAEKDRFYE